jgi:TIR domain
MTQASDMEEAKYEVALSFAGAHREYVRTVANRLTALGLAVFFDEDAQVEAWGRNLYDYLDATYRNKAKYVVAFVSAEYAVGPWPTLERQSAQAHALFQDEPYFLPVRMDDSEIPGLLPTTAYVDARIEGIDRLVELIHHKLRPNSYSQTEIPKNADQVRELISAQTPGWEYQLFAGVLNQEIEALDRKWRDYRLGLLDTHSDRLSDDEVWRFCSSQLSALRKIVDNLNRILDPVAQEEAFGPRGIPGESAAITHLAESTATLYEQLLDWAVTTRSANVPTKYVGLISALSQYAAQPIEEMRSFRDRYMDYTLALTDWLQIPESERPNFRVEMTVTFRLDDVITDLFNDEMRLVQGR